MGKAIPVGRAGRKRKSQRLGARALHIERLELRQLLAGRAAAAINAFAFDVYEQMQREEGNLLFSPLSVATTLSMTYAGAAGQTATEIQQVLHAGPEPGFQESFGSLLSSLPGQTGLLPPRLSVNSAVWPQTGMPLVPDFVNTMQSVYSSHIQAVDYRNPDVAEDTINSWVDTTTNGKIPTLVQDLTPSTQLVLTNTVYLRGLWQRPFPVNHTWNGTFTLDDGSRLSVPLMYTETEPGAPIAATTISGFKVVELPIAAGSGDADLSMTLVLPPAQGEQFLTSDLYSQIETWLDGPQPFVSALVYVPRFKSTVNTRLESLLIGLGMPSAFDPGLADFSGMTSAGLFLQKAFHTATLEVDEQGTTAAAATVFEFGICFAKGTPVLTPNGFVAIEDLLVGDQVLARHDDRHEGELESKAIERVFYNESEIFELRIGDRTIRTTATHPFYVKGKGWRDASELRPGDLLATNSSQWAEVEASRSTGKIEPVYNLQVADFHTYFVASTDRQVVVWVHNWCVGPPTVFAFNRPFDLIIRDNSSSTILFMGRINDPTQVQNSVIPTFVPEPSAAVLCAVGVVIAGGQQIRRRKRREHVDAAFETPPAADSLALRPPSMRHRIAALLQYLGRRMTSNIAEGGTADGLRDDCRALQCVDRAFEIESS